MNRDYIIGYNPQKAEAILKDMGFSLIKVLKGTRFDKPIEDHIYRNKGVIVIFCMSDENTSLQMIHFLSKVPNIGGNYDKINNLGLAMGQPFKKESDFYQDQTLHPHMNNLDAFKNCVSVIQSVCEKDYDFSHKRSRYYSYCGGESKQILEYL